jgi:hypothetical protein
LSVWRLCGTDTRLRWTTEHHVSKHTAGTSRGRWTIFCRGRQWSVFCHQSVIEFKMHTFPLNYFAGQRSVIWFIYFLLLRLHQALGVETCCGSSLVFPSFSGSLMASYSLKLIVHNLSGNKY